MSFASRVNAAFFAVTGKSLSSFASAWIRGDDSTLSGGSGNSARLTMPYSQSAYVRAAVNHIAGELSGRPLKFYQGENEYDDAAFTEWWAAPALGVKTLSGTQPRLGRDEVLRDLSAWASLEGEFLILLDDAWLLAGSSRNPAALTPFIIARPDRMAEIVQSGVLTGWRYTDAGGRQVILLPEQVIHWKGFSPYDDFRGVGDLQAARIAADSAFLTSVYMRDLMRNNGDQGAIVIAKSGVVDEPQRQQISASLREKRALLARGIARDLFLTGDITVDRPTEQSAGADVIAAKGMSHHEIFIAFGVPPSMAEVKQSYSIGKDSDRYQLITGTCQPRGNAIAGVLAKVASRQTGRALEAELDWDDHPVMVEVRNSRVDTALKLTTVGMPMKDANDYLGLGMKSYPGWEIGYLPFSVSPVDTSGGAAKNDPTQDPDLADTPPANEDPAVQSLRLLLLARQRMQCRKVEPSAAVESAAADPFAMFACCCAAGEGIAIKDRPAKEIAQWKTLMAQRREIIQGYESRFGRELMKARSEVLRKIAANYKPEKSVVGSSLASALIAKAGAAGDLLFDLTKFKDALLVSMRKQAAIALDTAGTQFFKEIGRDDAFKFPPEQVLEFVRGRENKLSNVAEDVFGRIKETLEEGITGGDTSDELAARIRTEFNGVSKGRSKTIAITETAAAYGTGRDEAMRTAGITRKAWLTSGNDNVRAAHLAAGKKYSPANAIPIDEPFDVGGDQLQFPGDPEGSPENIINCHCVSIAVGADDSAS